MSSNKVQVWLFRYVESRSNPPSLGFSSHHLDSVQGESNRLFLWCLWDNCWCDVQGEFNTYPPKKVYWGKGNLSGETFIVAGLVAFLISMSINVNSDYFYNSYCLSSSHYNMGKRIDFDLYWKAEIGKKPVCWKYISDNIIVVDGKYRWIPSRMRPPQHADGGYGYQDIEQDWTPTDGKGI